MSVFSSSLHPLTEHKRWQPPEYEIWIQAARQI